MGVAEVVQPDRRQLLLPQRLSRLGDLAGKTAGEPFRVPMGAIEIAEHGLSRAMEADSRAASR